MIWIESSNFHLLYLHDEDDDKMGTSSWKSLFILDDTIDYCDEKQLMVIVMKLKIPMMKTSLSRCLNDDDDNKIRSI